MLNNVPTLSTSGWVTDIATALNTLLAYAFTTDDKQSYLFGSQLTSIPRILQKAGMTARAAQSSIEQQLGDYLKKYFNTAQVQVQILNEDTDLSTSATLIISIQVDNQNEADTNSYSIRLDNGVFAQIVRLNNQGL